MMTKIQTNLHRRPNPSITILIFLLFLGSDTAYLTPTATGTPTERPTSVFHNSPLRLSSLEAGDSPIHQDCNINTEGESVIVACRYSVPE